MASAVNLKLENDLQQFKTDHQIEQSPKYEENPFEEKKNLGSEKIANGEKVVSELERLVCPPYPELFASGCIINGFTP